MLLVVDKTQDVYQRARAWTDEQMTNSGLKGPWARLGGSYRLPEELVPYLRSYIDYFMHGNEVNLPQVVPGAQLGLAIDPLTMQWIQAPPTHGIEAAVQAVLDMPGLASMHPVSFSDVTLLTSEHQEGLACVRLLEAKGIKVEHVFDPNSQNQRRRKMYFFMGDARVKACTIHSFKGWETRAMVLFISRARSLKDLELIYVGLTRLKRNEQRSYLTVVCSAPQLEPYGKSWPSFRKL